MIRWFFIGGAFLALAGCESLGLESQETTRQDDVFGRPAGPFEEEETTLLGGGIGTLFDTSSSSGAGVQLPVNRYLWRATLDTLSFLPLASTDPYGGVIVTDWGATPEAPTERYKVTTYITSAELRAQSLRVVVNRQSRNEDGSWVAAPSAPETARKLENAILTRARQIRIENPPEE